MKKRGRPAKSREGLARLQIYIQEELARQIRSILALSGTSQQDWLEAVIKKEIEKNKK